MKTLILGIAAFLFTCGSQAQNTNVTGVSRTTTTTVRDSDGEKKLTKTQNVNEVQSVELQDADSNALNKDVKATPVQVTASTTITAPDGTTRVVDVDRSAYYSLGGTRYQVAVDNSGYSLLSENNKKVGVLRPLSNNSYIYRNGDRTSVGYFDANGNLILQTYDEKTDKITTETLSRN
ncbi:MAG TPA: hypothetical protein VF581_03805 [Flavobacterium sp.]|jgi:hypothetical protein